MASLAAVLFSGSVLCSRTFGSEPRSDKVVLRSALAGTWYPADANELKAQLKGYFEKAAVEPRSDIIGLILPHAGYQYSGQTAAYAVNAIGRKYSRIIVIGPSHRMPMEEVLSVPRVTHYRTPLGEVAVDVEFVNRLLEHSIFQNVPRAQEDEHSVQIEVPLLQYKCGDFKLVPIVAGSCSAETIRQAGSIIKSLIDAETLVVASSDFVHYGANYGYVPFREDIAEQIRKLDMGAYEYIRQIDWRGFLEYRHGTGATICGYVPVAVLLAMLSGPVEVELAKYTTSGELLGDYSSSVSYLGIVFRGKWDNAADIRPGPAEGTNLSEQDKKHLLALARKSIVYALEHHQILPESQLDFELSGPMKQPRAAFVTFKKNSILRGCIGDIFASRPLYRSVMLNAVNAGLRDPRFPPVTVEECNDIRIEISALTPPEPVESADKIRIGTDGVVLNKDGCSAVFLPQVAPEQGWGIEQMLSQLSLKAGLAADAWKQGAQFLVFQADVFGEK